MSALCATEDGGRTWRPVFYTKRTSIPSFIRTSVRAGIISAGYWNVDGYWTRDNGKHWYHTDALRPPGFTFRPTFVLRADGLFFRSYDGNGRLATDVHSAVFHLDGWVPRGRISCSSERFCNGGMRTVRVGTATFDPENGTGFLSEADGSLATGTAADPGGLEGWPTSSISFAAEVYVGYEQTCLANGGSVSSKYGFIAHGRTIVEASPAYDSGSGVRQGFDLTAYGATVFGNTDPPPIGQACDVLVAPYPRGHITEARRTSLTSWLYVIHAAADASYYFELGRYPVPLRG